MGRRQKVMPRPAPTSVDLLDRAQPILSILHRGPQSSARIATALQWSQTTIGRRLLVLEQAGTIKRLGAGRTATWALASYEPPPPVCHVTPLAFGRKERPAPTPKPLTFQPEKRSILIPQDQPPSWWVGKSPCGFTTLAIKEFDRMRTSKEHFRIGLRILQ